PQTRQTFPEFNCPARSTDVSVDSAPALPSPWGSSDPSAFFRDYYRTNGLPVKGKSTQPEVSAYEAKFGKGTGNSPEKLAKIAQNVRKELRPPDPKDDGGTGDEGEEETASGQSSKYLIAIPIGIFFLAAGTLIVNNVFFRKIGWSWSEWQGDFL